MADSSRARRRACRGWHSAGDGWKNCGSDWRFRCHQCTGCAVRQSRRRCHQVASRLLHRPSAAIYAADLHKPGGAFMKKMFASVLLALVFVAPCFAQETPTEREAARDVVKQINALSQSLGVQAMEAKLSAP